MSMTKEIRLGVNIDHVATLRQARGTRYPDPVYAALIAQEHGADGITLHLREDRRHIQVRDVELLKQQLEVPMNLEIAATAEMLEFALRVKPEHCCIVPERRAELTTEGGLNVLADQKWLSDVCQTLTAQGIEVSFFIDADEAQINASKDCGARVIEIHTGQYAEAVREEEQRAHLHTIQTAALYAHQLGLKVNAGHGLHYHNVQAIAAIEVIHELNIGHSIVAKALFDGFAEAVRKMKQLMQTAR